MLFHPRHYCVIKAIGTVTQLFLSVAYAIHEKLNTQRRTNDDMNDETADRYRLEVHDTMPTECIRFVTNPGSDFRKATHCCETFLALFSETFLRTFFVILQPSRVNISVYWNKTTMHIVTVCTHNDGWFDALRVSCERNQCQLSVLGWGHPWKGLTWKFLLMQQFLNQCQNDNEVIAFVDAFDVIILEPSHVIYERFYTLTRNGSRVLLGVENPMRWHMTEVMKTMAFPNCGRHIISSETRVVFWIQQTQEYTWVVYTSYANYYN